MTQSENYPRWYAVMTRPNSEREAECRLRRKGLWTWYPFWRERLRRSIAGTDQFRVEWVERPYFRGYVFVGLRRHEALGTVNDTPGVQAVVSLHDEPLEIPHRVMDELMSRADGGGMVSERDETVRSLLRKGAVVRLGHNSPLSGLLAQVELDTGKEIRIWVKMLGGMRQATVPPEAVAAVEPR